MTVAEMTPKAGKNALTSRQRETLDFLRSFIAANGYPPTVRQICAALGISSTQTVHAHLARLERKGHLRLSHAHRTIQLLANDPEIVIPAQAGIQASSESPSFLDPRLRGDDGLKIEGSGLALWRPREGESEGERAARRADQGIPLIGRVAAGQPRFAVENVEGYVDLANLRDEQRVFALRVKGDSMIEAGILDGDYLLVRQQETAENGDIVVALLRDEATVKVFYRERGRIRLQPANAKMKPILAKQVSIIGKVVASFRGYGPVSLISDGE